MDDTANNLSVAAMGDIIVRPGQTQGWQVTSFN